MPLQESLVLAIAGPKRTISSLINRKFGLSFENGETKRTSMNGHNHLPLVIGSDALKAAIMPTSRGMAGLPSCNTTAMPGWSQFNALALHATQRRLYPVTATDGLEPSICYGVKTIIGGKDDNR